MCVLLEVYRRFTDIDSFEKNWSFARPKKKYQKLRGVTMAQLADKSEFAAAYAAGSGYDQLKWVEPRIVHY